MHKIGFWFKKVFVLSVTVYWIVHTGHIDGTYKQHVHGGTKYQNWSCIVSLQQQQCAEWSKHIICNPQHDVCVIVYTCINRKPIFSLPGKCLLALCLILMNNAPLLCNAKQICMIYVTLKSALSTLPFSSSFHQRLLGKHGGKLGIAK